MVGGGLWAEALLALSAKLPWSIVELLLVRLVAPEEFGFYVGMRGILAIPSSLSGEYAEVSSARERQETWSALVAGALHPLLILLGLAFVVRTESQAVLLAAAAWHAIDNTAIRAPLRAMRKAGLQGRKAVLRNGLTAAAALLGVGSAVAALGGGPYALLAAMVASSIGGWWVVLPFARKHDRSPPPSLQGVVGLFAEGVRPQLGGALSGVVEMALFSAALSTLPLRDAAVWGAAVAACRAGNYAAVLSGVAADRFQKGAGTAQELRSALRLQAGLALALAPLWGLLLAPEAALLVALMVAVNGLGVVLNDNLNAHKQWAVKGRVGLVGNALSLLASVGIVGGVFPATATALITLAVVGDAAGLLVGALALRRR